MDNTIRINARELYVLGTILEAVYMDYAYVAAMGPIGDSYKLIESETKDSLIRKNYLSENFSGDLEVDDHVSALLHPVFRGIKESVLDICSVGEETVLNSYRFHFGDDGITMVHNIGDEFQVESIQFDDIEKIVEKIVPDCYEGSDVECKEVPDKSKVTRLIAVKLLKIDDRSIIKNFFEVEGVIYWEDDEDRIYSVSKESLIKECNSFLKGEA